VAARAELIADRGAAAEADEFFRSRSFYAAEGVTHTLRIEAGAMTAYVPVLVREVPGSELGDATSPYGYPGGEIEGGPPPEPAAVDWAAAGLVSIFARERLGGAPWLASARERSAALLHDPARPRRLRGRLAEQIRANERRGWSIEALPGPATGTEERAAFEHAYEQTMTRAGAAERYFFRPEYFRSILGFERSWLFLARSPEGVVGAGAIAALSDGLMHYFLGGTADEHMGDSPFKNVVDAMVELADGLIVPLNLGGGARPGDGLEAFKRGFANGELPFRTHEVVCAPEEYERLSEGRPRTGFFPRYRAV
jgi:hypothetical protein